MHIRNFKEVVLSVHDSSELIAIVGANKHPGYPDTHVYLWDVRRRVRADVACEATVVSIGLALCRYDECCVCVCVFVCVFVC